MELRLPDMCGTSLEPKLWQDGMAYDWAVRLQGMTRMVLYVQGREVLVMPYGENLLPQVHVGSALKGQNLVMTYGWLSR